MVETQQRQIVEDFEQRISLQGLKMEQYYQMTGSNYDMLFEQVKPQAQKGIQSRLVLEAIVEKENIEASEEEFEKEIDKMAEMYQMENDKVKERLKEEGKKNIMTDIAIQKAIDFIVENAVEE